MERLKCDNLESVIIWLQNRKAIIAKMFDMQDKSI